MYLSTNKMGDIKIVNIYLIFDHFTIILLYLRSQRSSKLWEPDCFIPIELTVGQCNRCPVVNFIQNYPVVGAE